MKTKYGHIIEPDKKEYFKESEINPFIYKISNEKDLNDFNLSEYLKRIRLHKKQYGKNKKLCIEVIKRFEEPFLKKYNKIMEYCKALLKMSKRILKNS